MTEYGYAVLDLPCLGHHPLQTTPVLLLLGELLIDTGLGKCSCNALILPIRGLIRRYDDILDYVNR